MRKLGQAALIACVLVLIPPAAAQQLCPGFSIVIDTPEDELTLAFNGADTPQEQVAAIDAFLKEYPNSEFIPCAHEYYTIAYMKLNDFDKVIEHGEKGLSGEYRDVMMSLNTIKAYVASGRVSDAAFDIILKALPVIQAENTPSRLADISDEQWKEIQEQHAAQASDQRAYMEYAFFQLLQREPEPNKRLQWLNQFTEAYPDSPNAAQINFNYFLTHKMANEPDKAEEYAEKAVATDPENVVTLNVVADEYATRQTNLDKAEEYAKKALDLAPNMPKLAGMTDEQFKTYQDHQTGMARLTLGYIAFQHGSRTRRVAPAIEEFEKAAPLLEGNPALQGRALYYLGYAHEVISPPNHRAAIDALSRAAELPSPWQAQAQELLAKVRAAAR